MAKSVFISYRRRTGSTMAKMVCDKLRQWNYEVFLDVEELSAGDFLKEVDSRISRSDVFLLILSRDALERCSDPNDNVRYEILSARRYGVEIIPITDEDFVWPGIMPAGLEFVKRYNAIPYVQVYPEAFFDRLHQFIGSVPERERGGYASVSDRQPARPTSGRKKNGGCLIGAAVALTLTGFLCLAGMAYSFLAEFLTKPGTEISAENITPVETEHVSTLTDSYVVRGEDWNGSKQFLLGLELNDRTAYLSYHLEGKYASVAFDYRPNENRFDEECGLTLYLFDDDTEEVLAKTETLSAGSGAAHMEADVTGVQNLKILVQCSGEQQTSVLSSSPEAVLLLRDIVFVTGTPQKAAETEEEKNIMKLTSLAPEKSDRVSYLDKSYIFDDRDWKDAQTFSTDVLYTESFAEYFLDAAYSQLEFRYIPFRDKFVDGVILTAQFVDADTGNVLGTIEGITADTGEGFVSIDVSGVEMLRIVVTREGAGYGGGFDFSAGVLLIKDAVLIP